MLAVSQKGAREDWLLYFLEGVHSQAEDGCSRITQLVALRENYHALIKKDRSKKKLARFIDYLISTPITSVSQAQDALNIGSFTTIQRYIEKLESLGILREVTGQARNRIYRADEIMHVLEKPDH